MEKYEGVKEGKQTKNACLLEKVGWYRKNKKQLMNDIWRLARAIDDALTLLGESNSTDIPIVGNGVVAPSLLDQCVSLCKEAVLNESNSIRTIHHLSCTGGTLFCKCIASMPNVLMLNEVDPLSVKVAGGDGKVPFAPTDMIALLRQGDPNISSGFITELFINDLAFIRGEQSKIGRSLVLRDHAHSHFLTGCELEERQTLREIVQARFPIKSIVTVRDPVDSYLSMRHQGWNRHFVPSTFDEYCRRYLLFLQRYNDVDVIKYEAFVAKATSVMRAICDLLSLDYSDMFMETFDVHRFSGDSGRRGGIIEMRPRRNMDKEFLMEAMESECYSELALRLDYDTVSMRC
jgi:hypothetical protein